jgi:hypothetical protein
MIAEIEDSTGKTKTRRERYVEYINSEHWFDLRRQKIDANGKFCQCCSRFFDTVHVHHIYYRNLHDCTLDDLAVLCPGCHDDFHLACKILRREYIGVRAPEIREIVSQFRSTGACSKIKDRRAKKKKKRTLESVEHKRESLFTSSKPRRHANSKEIAALKCAYKSAKRDQFSYESLHRVHAIIQNILNNKPLAVVNEPVPAVVHKRIEPSMISPSVPDWLPGAGTVVLTVELLKDCTTGRCGISKRSAQALGVDYPLRSGWYERLVNKAVPVSAYREAVDGKRQKKTDA